jgi:hypothetical protein
MKYLERKQRCGSNAVVTANDKQSAEYFKGTLLERVASLENRLFQVLTLFYSITQLSTP